MSQYTELVNWFTRDGKNYKTVKAVSWEVGKKGSDLWMTVPVGFTFDVSVPRIFRWVIKPHDRRFLKAACLHDYTLGSGWDRVAAAALFADALKADGVSRLKRLVMTLGVIIWKFN